MESAVSEAHAVRREQQIRIPEVRRRGRDQVHLHGPVAELRGDLRLLRLRLLLPPGFPAPGRRSRSELPRAASRAALAVPRWGGLMCPPASGVRCGVRRAAGRPVALGVMPGAARARGLPFQGEIDSGLGQGFHGLGQEFLLSMSLQVFQVGPDDRLALGNDVLGHHPPLVVGLCLPLFHRDGPEGTFADAGPEAVAEQVTDKAGLAVDELQRSLRAVGYADAAAVAELVVDMDDLARHGWPSVSICCPQYAHVDPPAP